MKINYIDYTELLTGDVKELFDTAADCVLNEEIGEYKEDWLVEVSVSIVDEQEIKRLNAEFRNIDKITDVLSFPQYNDINDFVRTAALYEGEPLLLGDVVICFNRAEQQAKEYGHSLKREIIYLFVHSILHLLGYDHMNEDDNREMRTEEEIIMNRLGITRGEPYDR